MADLPAATAQSVAPLSVPVQARAQAKPRHRRSRWIEFFGVDARSLALFRFFISIVIIGDLIDKGRGMMSRAAAIELTTSFPYGSAPVVLFLLVVHGFLALCMAIGYRTRLMQFLNWVFTNGLIDRNIAIVHGGDTLLRALLFWSMFLPLGQCWSVDAALRKPRDSRRPRDSYVVSGASVAMIAQMIFMYLFSYIYKTDDVWRKDYTAAYYALRLDFFRRPMGDLLLHYPLLVKGLTFTTIWWELIGNAFYVMPIYTSFFRTFACVAYAGMHIGFGLSMRLGHFSWVGVAGQLPLIPESIWTFIFRRLKSPERKYLKLYYSPNSERHHLAARLVQTFLLVPGTEVAPVLVAGTEDISKEKHSSVHPATLARTHPNEAWIVVNYKGSVLTGEAATKEIIRRSPLLWPLRLLPGFLLSLLLRVVWALLPRLFDEPRVRSGKPKPRKTPAQYFWKIYPRFLLSGAVLLVLALVLCWNLDLTRVWPGNIGVHFNLVGDKLGIAQSWTMFSPRPPPAQFFLVIEGNLTSGDSIELWRDGSMYSDWVGSVPRFEKCNLLKAMPNHRLFKFFEFYLNHPGHPVAQKALADFICRNWNQRHPHLLLHHLRTYRIEEIFNLDGTSELTQAELVAHHICNIDESLIDHGPVEQVPEVLPGEEAHGYGYNYEELFPEDEDSTVEKRPQEAAGDAQADGLKQEGAVVDAI